VTIPGSVTSIGDRVFSNCSRLTSVTITGDTVTSVIRSGFRQVTTNFTVTISDSVASIGESAFDGCYLTGVTTYRTALPPLGSGLSPVAAA
jgi:hypothetical protein